MKTTEDTETQKPVRASRAVQASPPASSSREIWERLFVSVNTVNSHARSIYHKLQASSVGGR
jgi:FixJ family two-component response regulator